PEAVTPRTRPAPPAVPAPPPAAKSTRDPAAILSGSESATPPSVTNPPPSTTTRSTRAEVDAFTYFVQVGAFSRVEDAEQQRARLAMLGYTARVTEREQSGRTVYRVRLGPFERKEEAEMTQDRLRGSTIESALVRVER
ncbi:SPOR domain-containing protein, partial [uncultured Azohydromonas sp.]|uniref:SPOR domain-containing protein n=1 Tax=uncultured Azohydromonas sp. TaxID=487342 RepID=UPI002615D120